MVFAGSSSVHSGKMKNPYTFSKVVADDLCMLYKNILELTQIFVDFIMYGPHQLTVGEYWYAVGIFENQYKNKEPLTITGDGFQRRDFTHVDDIVDGLILTSENETCWDEIELGRGNNHSINELADMFNTETTYIDERPEKQEKLL